MIKRYNPDCSIHISHEIAFMREVSEGEYVEYVVHQQEIDTLRKQVAALTAENAYLINGASGELNTSWMFHKTMLGAQAALMCIVRGDIRSARDWLEGTTEEAGADIPDDIAVSELQAWFDRQMVSNDGNGGFLTRQQAEEAIRKEIPATAAAVAKIEAQARIQGINFAASRLCAAFMAGFIDKPVPEVADVVRMILSAKDEVVKNAAPEGLSGEYAEKVLNEMDAFAAELREAK